MNVPSHWHEWPLALAPYKAVSRPSSHGRGRGASRGGLSARLVAAFERPAPPVLDVFGSVRYRHPFRRSQTALLEEATARLMRGARQIHVVAPPGAGKTVVGLELVRRLGRAAVVLVPTTAIQEQWVERARDFSLPAATDVEARRPLTVLTYQSLTVAASEDELTEHAARLLWIEGLSATRGMSVEEAAGRIAGMQAANPAEYGRELSVYKRKLRQEAIDDDGIDLLRLLHPGARALMQVLLGMDVGTVVLDECHHLTGFWALVVGELCARLSGPVIVGLTATPPVARENVEMNRYLDLVGEVDIEVPTPALVKEGQLSPYQDLVFLARPTAAETRFIDSQHATFRRLVNDLLQEDGVFLAWVAGRAAEAGELWRRRPGLLRACIKLLRNQRRPYPRDIVPEDELQGRLSLPEWMDVLEDFALNRLKLSGDPDLQQRYEDVRTATRSLGLTLTERGFRRSVSPVDRVLAMSRNKLDGLVRILQAERAAQREELRALVLVDYEKTSPTALREVQDVLDPDAGGALAVIRALVESDVGNALDPVMVTGSTVLCDSDVVTRLVERGHAWARSQGLDLQLRAVPVHNVWLHELAGQGSDWSTGTYTRLVTMAFEEGLTRCLVGTRALLGEGWDALSINVLVDLTSVTASTAVNQVRGRSLRVDPSRPQKVADNWDVVCLAPEYEEGFNDYDRFVRKHDGFYGLCDDGQVARGVEHVHVDFTRTHAEALAEKVDAINAVMLQAPMERSKALAAWRVGQPYVGAETVSVEVFVARPLGLRPVHIQQGGWDEEIEVEGPQQHSRVTQAALQAMATAVLNTLSEAGALSRPCEATDIVTSLRQDGFYSFSLSTGSSEDAAAFAQAFREVVSPLGNPQWVMPRYELESPGDGTVEPGRAPRRLASWHAVPGRNRTFVQAFDRNWNRLVSPGDPVSVRKPEGKAVLDAWQGQNPLGVVIRQRVLWH